MKILGIDPGTKNLGYGIIEFNSKKEVKLIKAGVVKFKETDLQHNIKSFEKLFEPILEEFHVDEVAMETIFFAFNPKSVIKLAQFRGAILAKLLFRYEKIFEYSPLEIKKSLTGTGRGTKQDVNFAVKKFLSIEEEIKPLDISDALGVAITHLNSHLKKEC
jgi:crossover junction endodeoxyribonuclease RuvC